MSDLPESTKPADTEEAKSAVKPEVDPTPETNLVEGDDTGHGNPPPPPPSSGG